MPVSYAALWFAFRQTSERERLRGKEWFWPSPRDTGGPDVPQQRAKWRVGDPRPTIRCADADLCRWRCDCRRPTQRLWPATEVSAMVRSRCDPGRTFGLITAYCRPFRTRRDRRSSTSKRSSSLRGHSSQVHAAILGWTCLLPLGLERLRRRGACCADGRKPQAPASAASSAQIYQRDSYFDWGCVLVTLLRVPSISRLVPSNQQDSGRLGNQTRGRTPAPIERQMTRTLPRTNSSTSNFCRQGRNLVSNALGKGRQLSKALARGTEQ
jgi:hypothetical protein